MTASKSTKDILKEVEDFIARYEQLKINTELLEKERNEIVEMICSLPGITYDEVLVQSSVNTSSVTEKNALMLAERKLDIDIKIQMNKSTIRRIEKALESIDIEDKNILIMRVIEKKSWKYISRETNYSERQARYRKYYALEKMAGILFGSSVFNSRQ